MARPLHNLLARGGIDKREFFIILGINRNVDSDDWNAFWDNWSPEDQNNFLDAVTPVATGMTTIISGNSHLLTAVDYQKVLERMPELRHRVQQSLEPTKKRSTSETPRDS